MKKILFTALLAGLLAACSSEKAPAPVTENSAPTSTTSSSTPTAQTPTQSTVQTDELNDPNSILAKRSVYYALDSSEVKQSDLPIIQAHARYLANNPSRTVRLEGNCDERGSDEYNLALGQRRADAVKKLLLAGGARESQIETISYGEEKPRATGHNEEAWAQNRRTDFNYR